MILDWLTNVFLLWKIAKMFFSLKMSDRFYIWLFVDNSNDGTKTIGGDKTKGGP